MYLKKEKLNRTVVIQILKKLNYIVVEYFGTLNIDK